MEVTRQAWMSASCLSMASSLELSLGLEGEPCAGMPTRTDVAKLRRVCRVSVGTLTVLAFSVLGSVILKTRSHSSWIVWVRET